ncbi:possible respiratory chain protein [Pyrobaculum aerophilum str. IM2]|uniref:Possible respiratory chain protein n=2 Tax=Pyrobaculum aerophilum TaxID=13773 RepID=Q8ZXC8_PYRAE|nr:hypothetical protein [Pyrobaculum aerophilum]AAL63420.1 possible respiratory chain protein [Pyrobaculum aerophilum str. IM2]HII45981.1 respiratory chain protein [Pyrobaculum aerophilum]
MRNLFPSFVKYAFISALATSFVGGLTAGLGQGFDLGTQWPGPVLTMVLLAISGSFEPIHRFLTVLTSALYVAVFAYSLRIRSRVVVGLAALALAFLIATALTGRAVLLVLGGEIKPPLAFAIYPLNNSLALLTAATMALLWSLVTPVKTYSHILAYRGAAFWGFVASVSGAYILGYHKITKTPLSYSIPPALTASEIPWIIHLVAAALSVALAIYAFLKSGERDFWHWAALTSALAQPITGVLMFVGASRDPWAPGPQTALHAAFAHLLVISAFVIYARGRFGRR